MQYCFFTLATTLVVMFYVFSCDSFSIIILFVNWLHASIYIKSFVSQWAFKPSMLCLARVTGHINLLHDLIYITCCINISNKILSIKTYINLSNEFIYITFCISLLYEILYITNCINIFCEVISYIHCIMHVINLILLFLLILSNVH